MTFVGGCDEKEGFAMQTFLRIDLNLFMIVVCMIIYFSSRRMSESRLMHNRLFRLITVTVGLLLIIESLTWILDGASTLAAFYVNYGITICQYILTPLPAFFWGLYVKCQLFQNARSLRMDAILYGIPIVACILLTLSTPLTDLMFFFDGAFIYHRGVLYPLLAATSLLPILASIACVVLSGKRVSPKYAKLLLLVPIAIIGISLVQIFLYGVTLIWSGIALALLFAFMNFQNDQVYLDHLTGVFNRRQMDIFLADRIRIAKDGRTFSCVMLDIDHFKMVNDKLGHVAGDEALKDASNILKSSIRKSDFLARYGGDEFLIVADIDDNEALQSLIDRINQNSSEFNENMQRPYRISFSAGQAIYASDGWIYGFRHDPQNQSGDSDCRYDRGCHHRGRGEMPKPRHLELCE